MSLCHCGDGLALLPSATNNILFSLLCLACQDCEEGYFEVLSSIRRFIEGLSETPESIVGLQRPS
jgi:hypothetical protein